MSGANGRGRTQNRIHAFDRPLSDFDDLAGFFVGWNGRFEQLSTGTFEGRLKLVRGKAIQLVSLDCNQVILARGRRESGLFTVYSVNSTNAGGLWQSQRLAPGQLVVHGPEADTNHLSARKFTSAGLSI